MAKTSLTLRAPSTITTRRSFLRAGASAFAVAAAVGVVGAKILAEEAVEVVREKAEDVIEGVQAFKMNVAMVFKDSEWHFTTAVVDPETGKTHVHEHGTYPTPERQG